MYSNKYVVNQVSNIPFRKKNDTGHLPRSSTAILPVKYHCMTITILIHSVVLQTNCTKSYTKSSLERKLAKKLASFAERTRPQSKKIIASRFVIRGCPEMTSLWVYLIGLTPPLPLITFRHFLADSPPPPSM